MKQEETTTLEKVGIITLFLIIFSVPFFAIYQAEKKI